MPKYDTDDDDLPGPLDGHALVGAQRGCTPAANCSCSSPESRGDDVRVVEREPELGRPGADRGLVAEDGQLGDPALAGACSRRAGCGRRRPRAARCACGRARARSSRSYSNISGVTTSGRGSSSRANRASGSTCCSNSASAVSILRWESVESRPRVAAGGARAAERPEVGADDRHPLAEALHEPPERPLRVVAAVEDDPGQRREADGGVRGEQPEQDVDPVARGDDDGAVGQPVQQVLERHRADQDVERLAGQELLVADDEPPADGLHERARPWGRRGTGTSGSVHAGTSPSSAARTSSRSPVHRFATTPITWAWLVRSSPIATSATCRTSAGLRPLPLTTSSAGAPRFAAMRRVEGQLGRAGDVGVVRPDDDDDVAPARDLVVPGHDVGQGLLRVGVHLLVGDPESLLVGRGRRRPARAGAPGRSPGGRWTGRSAGTPRPAGHAG